MPIRRSIYIPEMVMTRQKKNMSTDIYVNDEAIINKRKEKQGSTTIVLVLGEEFFQLVFMTEMKVYFQANVKHVKTTCRSVSVEVGICFPPDG